MLRRLPALAVLFWGLSAAHAEPAVAQWNVYVYMNAQPNLDDFALKDIEEMKLAGASPDVNVFVQLALSDHQVRRYVIQPGDAQLVDELGAIDPFDSRNLADFVTWAHEKYPARRHAIVVWGHGASLPERIRQVIPESGGDQFSRRGMDLKFLHQSALRIRRALGRRVDVWGYDSCFMGRVEVGYELRGAARFMVASQDTVDAAGWDYNAWLSQLLDRPSMDGSELAQLITRLSSLSPAGDEREIACIDLLRYRSLTEAVSLLGEQLSSYAADRGHMASIVTAHYRARRYVSDERQTSAYLDLDSLAASFIGPEFPPELVAAAREVQQAVAKAVLLRFGDFRSSGISIFHQLKSRLPSDYLSLDFSRDTHWDDYLSGPRVRREHRPEGRIYPAPVLESIPDARPEGLLSLIAVEDEGNVHSARLFLHIAHEYVGDLKVTLTSPSGRQVVVLNRVGGNGRNVRGWVNGEEISRVFAGEGMRGDWQLRVADLSDNDVGRLISWRLELVVDEAVGIDP